MDEGGVGLSGARLSHVPVLLLGLALRSGPVEKGDRPGGEQLDSVGERLRLPEAAPSQADVQPRCCPPCPSPSEPTPRLFLSSVASYLHPRL